MTDKISTQVRTVSVGILVLTWGLLVGESSAAKNIASQLKGSLLAIGLAAIMVMVLDFLQYVAGYFDTLGVLRRVEAQGAKEGTWNPRSILYRVRQGCFYSKQFLLIAVVLAMLWRFWGYLRG
jgi:hypothetical protein